MVEYIFFCYPGVKKKSCIQIQMSFAPRTKCRNMKQFPKTTIQIRNLGIRIEKPESES